MPAPPPLSEPAMVRADGIFFWCVTRKTDGRGISFPHRGVVLQPFQIAVARTEKKVIGKPLDRLGCADCSGFDPTKAFRLAGHSPLVTFCINALTSSKNNTKRQNRKCAFAGTVPRERLPIRKVQ